MNDDTDYPRCGNCQLYEHVAEEDRTGRQWLYATGRCAYKPPSSHRPVKPKTADTNWCHNWRAQVDVSKAIIEEGNRRYEEKTKKIEPEEALTLPDEGEPEPPEQEDGEDMFVDRSYRPYPPISPWQGKLTVHQSSVVVSMCAKLLGLVAHGSNLGELRTQLVRMDHYLQNPDHNG